MRFLNSPFVIVTINYVRDQGKHCDLLLQFIVKQNGKPKNFVDNTEAIGVRNEF